jgi:hypothetical protein
MVAESHQKCCYESFPERIAADAHQNIAVKAVQRKCCQISTKYCCKRKLKIDAEAHQNIAARADQKKIAVESHQNIAVKSCKERIATESHQNIAVKVFQRNGCRIATKISKFNYML